MRPIYYSQHTKESNSVNVIERIMREVRDLNALIKANECYLSETQKQVLKEDIKETLSL